MSLIASGPAAFGSPDAIWVLKKTKERFMELNCNLNDTSTTVVRDEAVCAKSPRKRRAPGVPAKKTGKRLKRGLALQVMIYPRAAAKAVIVEGSRRAKKSLSSFCIMSALKEATSLLGRPINDLGISEKELRNYV
jgi:hypothetical protein